MFAFVYRRYFYFLIIFDSSNSSGKSYRRKKWSFYWALHRDFFFALKNSQRQSNKLRKKWFLRFGGQSKGRGGNITRRRRGGKTKRSRCGEENARRACTHELFLVRLFESSGYYVAWCTSCSRLWHKSSGRASSPGSTTCWPDDRDSSTLFLFILSFRLYSSCFFVTHDLFCTTVNAAVAK